MGSVVPDAAKRPRTLGRSGVGRTLLRRLGIMHPLRGRAQPRESPQKGAHLPEKNLKLANHVR